MVLEKLNTQQLSLKTDISLLNQQSANQNTLPQYSNSKRSLKGLNNLLKQKLSHLLSQTQQQNQNQNQQYQDLSSFRKPYNNLESLKQSKQNPNLFKHIKKDIETLQVQFSQIKEKQNRQSFHHELGWAPTEQQLQQKKLNKITPETSQNYLNQCHQNWLQSQQNTKHITKYAQHRQQLKNSLLTTFFTQNNFSNQNLQNSQQQQLQYIQQQQQQQQDLSQELQQLSLQKQVSSSSLVYTKDFLSLMDQIEKNDHPELPKQKQFSQQNLQNMVHTLQKSNDYPLWKFIDFLYSIKIHQIQNQNLYDLAIQYLQHIFKQQYNIQDILLMLQQQDTHKLKQILEQRFSFLNDDYYSQNLDQQYQWGYLFLILRSHNFQTSSYNKNEHFQNNKQIIDEFISLYMDSDMEQVQEINIRQYWENYIDNNIQDNRQQFYIQNNCSNYIKNHYFLQQILNIFCKQSQIVSPDFITHDDDYLWLWLNIVQIQDDQQNDTNFKNINNNNNDDETLSKLEFQELIRSYIQDEKDTISEYQQLLYLLLIQDQKGLLKSTIDYLETMQCEYQIVWIVYFLLKINYLKDLQSIPNYLQQVYKSYIKLAKNNQELQQELTKTAQISLQNVLQSKVSQIMQPSSSKQNQQLEQDQNDDVNLVNFKGATKYDMLSQYFQNQKSLNKNLQRQPIVISVSSNTNSSIQGSQQLQQEKSLFQKKVVNI